MTRRLPALSAMVILLAACGGDDDAGDSAADRAATTAESAASDTVSDDGAPEEPVLDSCSLLTTDEVESTLGGPAPGVAEDYPPQFYGCRWETDDLDNISLSILVYTDADEAAASFADTVDRNGYAPIDGLGDRAYDTSPIRGITAQTGRYEASLSVFVTDDDDQAMIDLLGAVLGRLAT